MSHAAIAPPHTTTLIITALPAKSHVGIDTASFTTTPTFTGIKLVPAGLHVLWVSPFPSLTLRSAHWIHTTTGTLSFRYDASSESLLPSPSENPTITPEAWSHALTAYRQRDPRTSEESESAAPWQHLISHVTPSVLSYLFGPSWALETTTQSLDSSGDDAAESALLDKLAPSGPEAKIKYTPIDLKVTWPPTAVGRERTYMARDRSWALGQALGTNPDLLGELEAAFVGAYFVGNYVSATQWGRICGLFLTCREAAVGGREPLFVEFLGSLRRMLEVAGEDGGVLAEAVDGVKKGLKGFGRMLREEDGGREVRKEWEVLVGWAERRLEWVLDTRDTVRKGTVMTEEGDIVEVEEEGLEEEEERGEYAPAIVEDVEMDENLERRVAGMGMRDLGLERAEKEVQKEVEMRDGSESPVVILMAEDDEDDPRY